MARTWQPVLITVLHAFYLVPKRLQFAYYLRPGYNWLKRGSGHRTRPDGVNQSLSQPALVPETGRDCLRHWRCKSGAPPHQQISHPSHPCHPSCKQEWTQNFFLFWQMHLSGHVRRSTSSTSTSCCPPLPQTEKDMSLNLALCTLSRSHWQRYLHVALPSVWQAVKGLCIAARLVHLSANASCADTNKDSIVTTTSNAGMKLWVPALLYNKQEQHRLAN